VDVEYRRLGPEQAGEVLTVQRAAFVSEARLYGTVEIPPLIESHDELRRELEANLIIGAFLGSRLVGSARLTVDGTTGWISRVAVAPDQQGRGVGRGLLDALEGAAPAGVVGFRLAAAGASAANIAMYERRGYREVGRQPDAVGIEVVVMAKARG